MPLLHRIYSFFLLFTFLHRNWFAMQAIVNHMFAIIIAAAAAAAAVAAGCWCECVKLAKINGYLVCANAKGDYYGG